MDDPLSAGWTAEVSADRLPEVHEAMETEARQRLASFISEADQQRLDVQIVLGTGPADEEIVRYANAQAIDLVIVQANPADAASSELAQTVLAGARSAVLVLR